MKTSCWDNNLYSAGRLIVLASDIQNVKVTSSSYISYK
jgi:hypothetical protein